MKLFSPKQPVRFVLIDIRADMIAYACMFRESTGKTTICFSASLPIEQREAEDTTGSLVRTFGIVCSELITYGVPILKNASGSGKIDSIMVQIAGPWQHTEISRTESTFEVPTTISHAVITRAVKEGRSREHEDDLMEETMLSTTLNGYTVKEPIGKQAHTIASTAMRSYLPYQLRSTVESVIRSYFHSSPVTFVAFESTVYAAIVGLAPFHTDFCIMSIDDNSTNVLLSQNGSLVKTVHLSQGTCSLLESVKHAQTQVPHDANEEARNARFAETSSSLQSAWAQSLFDALRESLKPYSMPQTLFLITHNDSRDFISRMLEQAPLGKLWMSGINPTIIPVMYAAYTKQVTFSSYQPDLGLALLALRS